MRIIDASFDVLPRDERRGGLKIIEQAGRLCYRSDLRPAAAPAAGGGLRAGTAGMHGSPSADADVPDKAAEAFVRGLIRRRHLSVLEHGDMIFEISDRHIYENVADQMQRIRDDGGRPPMLAMTGVNHRYIVSGRGWNASPPARLPAAISSAALTRYSFAAWASATMMHRRIRACGRSTTPTCAIPGRSARICGRR